MVKVCGNTLVEEFFSHLFTPLLAEFPRPTRVTDVCTLQGHLYTHTHTHRQFHELSPLLYTLFLYIVVFCASLSGLAHLQDEVAVRGVSQTQLLLVQVCPEPGQVFVLPADICGQNQRPQLPLHVHTEQRDHRISRWLYCL